MGRYAVFFYHNNMEYLYKTVLKPARIEYIVEKSKFIASVIPCESREEVDAFFDEIRREFKDATHNVPAFVLGDKMELKWASDDGEPQGTSGPPILKVIEGKGLTNIAIVVTRYFGGIKLGTGGLVRAYSKSADQVINESGIAGAALYNKMDLVFNYGDYNKFLSYKFPDVMKESMIIGETVFKENVEVSFSCHKDVKSSFCSILKDLTNGGIIVKERGEILERFALTMDE